VSYIEGDRVEPGRLCAGRTSRRRACKNPPIIERDFCPYHDPEVGSVMETIVRGKSEANRKSHVTQDDAD
jgi:hypothetical protein